MGLATPWTRRSRTTHAATPIFETGYRVVRVPAVDVMRDPDEVAQGLVEAALAKPSA